MHWLKNFTHSTILTGKAFQIKIPHFLPTQSKRNLCNNANRLGQVHPQKHDLNVRHSVCRAPQSLVWKDLGLPEFLSFHPQEIPKNSAIRIQNQICFLIETSHFRNTNTCMSPLFLYLDTFRWKAIRFLFFCRSQIVLQSVLLSNLVRWDFFCLSFFPLNLRSYLK